MREQRCDTRVCVYKEKGVRREERKMRKRGEKAKKENIEVRFFARYRRNREWPRTPSI